MADSKITALASIGTGADPANDPLVIVDVSDVSPGGMSATGTTKKVTLNNLLACSPTATLASATITGDLTVDTSTLKVDSTNNRVGVNTASPASALDVQGSSLRLQVQSSSNGAYSTWKYIGKNSTGTAVNFEQGLNIAADNAFELYDNQNTQLVSRYVSGGSGYHSWFLSGTTAMTLSSTGLGIGETAPFGQKLSVNGAASVRNGSKFFLWDTGNSTAHGIYNTGDNLTFIKNNGTTSMTLDASGRLILLASTTTPATLGTNGQLTFTATSDTNLRFSYRGSDGVTRVANLTLA